MSDFLNSITSLHRYNKRAFAIITDIFLCILSTWLAFVIRLDQIILVEYFNFKPALISVAIAIPVFWFFGLYRTIFRYTGLSIVFTVLSSTLVYGSIFFLIIGIIKIHEVPRSIGILQPMLLFFGIMSSRLLVKKFLFDNLSNNNLKTKKMYLFMEQDLQEDNYAYH